jgi:hypothetical protein
LILRDAQVRMIIAGSVGMHTVRNWESIGTGK